MLVQEQNAKFNDVMNKIFTYLNSNLNIKKDLEDYYKAININKQNKDVLNRFTLNYIFERRIGKEKKTIFDFALTDLTTLTNEEREIINSFKNSIDGIFEVRKLTPSLFELFNIINEKLYNVRPLAKITNFRNLSVGHFVFAKVIKYQNEYFLYHITDHVNYSNRITAFQIAVSRLAQMPSLLYFDNPEKLEELKNSSKNFKEKFDSLFAEQYVLTSSKYADNLIELLNDFIETNIKPSEQEISKYIKPIKKYSYFDVNEINQGTNILVQAKKGFSAQEKKYNVALLADEFVGLQIIPFLDIFLSIFEKENYKNIKNYKECLMQILKNQQYSPVILKIAYEKFNNVFIDRINEILETNYKNLDEIIADYKSFYIENPYSSSTLTLYSSYAFKKLLIATEENEEEKLKIQNQKVGRNDACPCGSGLKFKKCCGKQVQI